MFMYAHVYTPRNTHIYTYIVKVRHYTDLWGGSLILIGFDEGDF